ncbi:MAG: transcriptional regulator [Actinobacteria bacterium]|nr:transcriptional regulator [Actinomycetota bacterium]
MPKHPALSVDDRIHQRTRLAIVAVLAGQQRAEFLALREVLGLTDGNLSRHLRVLEDAGFVRLEKAFVDRRPKTWVRLTERGVQAYAAEIETLRRIVAQARVPRPPAGEAVTRAVTEGTPE